MNLIQYLKQFLDSLINDSINPEDLKKWNINVVTLLTSLKEYKELPEDASISICFISDFETEISYKNSKNDEVNFLYRYPSLEPEVFYNGKKLPEMKP